jgi:tRNA(Ile)-lysidine synthase
MTPAGDPKEPATWPSELCLALAGLPTRGTLTIALSGGLDSVFLLHSVAHWYRDFPDVLVKAIHVNHNLNAGAGRMAGFCEKLCAGLALPLRSRSVVVPTAAASLENSARQVRYQIFEENLEPGQHLLMAHHRDDQTETVLFRLVRGGGVRGLAGMPRQRALGEGTLLRPLLSIPRAKIYQWARAWQLDWVEDPSNADCTFDRNFLRHEIVPAIEKRWPGAGKSMAGMAGYAAESDFLNTRLAAIQRIYIEDSRHRLCVTALGALTEIEQSNLVRCWIRDFKARPPGASKLAQGLRDLIMAAADRSPVLEGDGFSIRRFSGHLYFVATQSKPPEQTATWSTQESLEWAGGQLRLHGDHQRAPVLQVTRRQGGERFRPRAGGPSRPLKKWLQENGVPPWERERLPLIWCNDELVAVGNLWPSAAANDAGPHRPWRIIWEPCRR